MGVTAVLWLSFSLAMDATAVAASRGLLVPRVQLRHVLAVALWFGGFQALMPLVGYGVGAALGDVVAAFDHWIAFSLLSAIGGKMLWEAWRGGGDDDKPQGDPFAWRVLLVLAVATSIDALAAGFTLPLLDAPLLLSIATIGGVTAVLSALGIFAGRRFGAALGARLEVVGGLVLIALGCKTLFEHLNV
jgi:putative Mn2+ efflux pump MntP